MEMIQLRSLVGVQLLGDGRQQAEPRRRGVYGFLRKKGDSWTESLGILQLWSTHHYLLKEDGTI